MEDIEKATENNGSDKIRLDMSKVTKKPICKIVCSYPDSDWSVTMKQPVSIEEIDQKKLIDEEKRINRVDSYYPEYDFLKTYPELQEGKTVKLGEKESRIFSSEKPINVKREELDITSQQQVFQLPMNGQEDCSIIETSLPQEIDLDLTAPYEVQREQLALIDDSHPENIWEPDIDKTAPYEVQREQYKKLNLEIPDYLKEDE